MTAGRVRQRIGAVMKWAVAQGYRDDNPAGDVLSAALPKTAVRKQHMRALPHAEVAAALARVRGSGAYPGAMLALEFLVLTAARSGEVRSHSVSASQHAPHWRGACKVNSESRTCTTSQSSSGASRCCFPLYLVGAPYDLTGLFRRRFSWDDGAIRDTSDRGEVVFLMNDCCRSGGDVVARVALAPQSLPPA